MWTTPEINQYLELRNKYDPLEKLYKQMKIEEDDVENKSKYLIGYVLNLTMTDEDLLNCTIHNEGRAKGLIFLENLVMSSHKEIVKKQTENIDVEKIKVL